MRLPHISIGSLLRSYARDESEVAVGLTRTMALGNLVPDTLVLDVLAARMSEPDCARGLILDGFPRTLKQAERLECGLLRSQFCANDRTENLLAIHLRVQNSTIVGRLSGRRICSRCSASYHVDSQPPFVRTTVEQRYANGCDSTKSKPYRSSATTQNRETCWESMVSSIGRTLLKRL